jgi:hypothetical protein
LVNEYTLETCIIMNFIEINQLKNANNLVKRGSIYTIRTKDFLYRLLKLNKLFDFSESNCTDDEQV